LTRNSTKTENLKPKYVLISGIGLSQIKGKLLQLHFSHYIWLKLKHGGGAEYKESHNHEETNTVKKVNFTAANKFQKAQAELEHHLKPSFDGFQIKVESDILGVSSLGAFYQFATNTLENILETKSKKTISIWGRRIVIATIKGSFDIWLKKSGWTSFVQKHSFNINKEIAELDDDDLDTSQRKKDFIIEMSQIALVHECRFGEIDMKGQQEINVGFRPDEIQIQDPYDEFPEQEEPNWPLRIIDSDTAFDPIEDIE
jgi:hypothetical protein